MHVFNGFKHYDYPKTSGGVNTTYQRLKTRY